jgi:hypothetical protein
MLSVKSDTETYNMLMEVYGDEYLVLKFSSGSKDLNWERERSKTIRVPVDLPQQKQKVTLKNSVKLFEKIVI